MIADLKTLNRFGCFPAAVITSITFQNTTGVYGAVAQSAEVVRGQAIPIFEDYSIEAIKTGMLPTAEVINEITNLLAEYRLPAPVVDPVVRSTSGFDLIDDLALRSLIEKLFPLSVLVTPNLPEAERITGLKINDEAGIRQAASVMLSQGAPAVLIKGGHTKETASARDYLFADGSEHVFEAEMIRTTATHGTGCTLSAAISANLALGKTLPECVQTAKAFVTEAIRTAPHLGKGFSPINHNAKI